MRLGLAHALVAVVAVVACGSRPAARAPAAAAAAPAHYELHLDPRDPHALRFEAHFVGGGSAALGIDEDMQPALTSVEVARAGGWAKLDVAHMRAPECATDCRLRYVIDLAKAQTSHEGIASVGHDAWLAPTSTWLMHPSPMPHGTFDLTVEPYPDPPADHFESVPFATGMRRASGSTHFTMSTGDFGEGSYAAFGAIRHRLVESAGGKIEVVSFEQPKMAMTDDELAAWVKQDGACVAQLYGHFPVPRATVFLVPLSGVDEVVFGRVLSMGGASIAALAGAAMPFKETHDDWVLVHEMVHLGFPTVFRERWIGEGLATYYEPVLRTRTGWRTPERFWEGFAHSMPRGVPARGEELALDKRGGIDDIYWGGAVFLMMTDIGIRVATHNAKSLDTVLRAILAEGGDATVAWTLDRIIEVADRVTGTHVMSELHERQAVRGERVDLATLFAKLGVVPNGKHVQLDDHAEWADIRRGITAQTP